MIKVDSYGIVVDPTSGDGGESCSRTALLARKYPAHRANMPLFVVRVGNHYELVRHPFQKISTAKSGLMHCDPRATSRDMLIMWASGVDENSTQEEKDCCYYYAEKGWVNWDFLNWSERLYLYGKSGRKPKLTVRLLGPLNTKISMWWNTRDSNKDEEINQFTGMCWHFGYLTTRQLYADHPNFEGAIRYYWGKSWRQPEIGETYIEVTRTIIAKGAN